MKFATLWQRVSRFVDTLVHIGNLRFRLEQNERYSRELRDENIAIRNRCDDLENRIERLETSYETLAERVEHEVARQLYYQSLSLQHRVDQLGFDARIAESATAE